MLLGNGVLVLWDYFQVRGSLNTGVSVTFPVPPSCAPLRRSLLGVVCPILGEGRKADPECSRPETVKVAAESQPGGPEAQEVGLYMLGYPQRWG